MSQNLKVILREGRAIAPLQLNRDSARFLMHLEGRSIWLKSGGLSFESTFGNVKKFKSQFPNIEFPEEQEDFNEFGEFIEHPPYTFKTEPYEKQREAFIASRDKLFFAYFMEPGTGKSKVLLDKAGYLWSKGRISALLVISLPGLHRQWVETQIPEHLNVPYKAEYWTGKPVNDRLLQTGTLSIFSTYIHALRVKKHQQFIDDFIKAHKGYVLCVIDESTSIKNSSSGQYQNACYTGNQCRYRAIMSGTPYLNEITDLWGQFSFLSESILEIRYKSTFIKEYCELGENHKIVGPKNVDRLHDKIGPHMFRALKSDMLDLPERIYSDYVFDMEPEQRLHFENMKNAFLSQIDSGEIASSPNGAVALMRLQQISCGWLTLEDGTIHELPNARIKALKELLDTMPDEQVIIWARFQKDVENIMNLLGEKAVHYYGKTEKNTDRPENIDRFMSGKVQYFVSNPTAGGIGLNLQGNCKTVVYYSNSFSALDRWQSEDRSHRIGTIHNVQYINMIAKGSRDRHILRALREKKDIASLTLGDMKDLLNDE